MTDPHTANPPARRAIEGHLQRVELHLAAAKIPRPQRDEVLGSIAAQYQDHLAKPYTDASRQDINHALAQLAPPDSFYTPSEPSLIELLRLLGQRLCPGGPAVPVCYVNDKAQRKILWAVLGPRLLILIAFIAVALLASSQLTRPDLPLLNPINLLIISVFAVSITATVFWQIRRTPVEQLPRENEVHRDANRLSLRQFAIGVLTCAVLLAAAWVLIYAVLGLAQRTPLLPLSTNLARQTVIAAGVLSMAVMLATTLTHRRKHQRIQQFL